MPPPLPHWLQPAPGSLLDAAMRRGRPPWSEFAHLLWSMWVFIVPVFTPEGYDARWWLLTLLSYPLFVALYTTAMLAPPRRLRAAAMAIVALSLALMPWYPAGMSYFVFGCVFLGSSRRWHAWWQYALALLALNALFLAWARAIGYPWSAVIWMPLTSVAVGMAIHVQRLAEHKDAALRLSHEEVRRLAATAERERIGRDLHDLLGHTLSLVALKADLAGRLLQHDRDAARREIGELGQVARDALAQVRHAVTGIRAARLAAELATARLVLESAGVQLDAEVDEAAVPPPEQETVLALCLREAVTNVQRHARARRVRLQLHGREGCWQLCVEDDGRGGAIQPGNGLAGMRERLEALGGSLRVQAGTHAGTRLVAELPQ